MINTNSRSETVWELLHGAQALVGTKGFVPPHPPAPTAKTAAPLTSSLPFTAILDKFRDRLALGTGFPPGWGTQAPLALLITRHELSAPEIEFVRSWFVNARIQYPLEETFWIQPLPSFAGETAPYRAFFEDVCRHFQPRAVFSLGAEPAQLLLGAPLSVDTLRTGDFRLGTWSLLTTLDPADYTALPEDAESERRNFKGQVWKDVQRLVGKLKYA